MARKKRPSAVEVSPHRREIEEMILEGKSDRFIADWLISVGEKISYGAVFNYRKNKFNVKEEAVKNYNEKKSKERKTKAVNKVVSDLDALDEIIREGSDLKLNINDIDPDEDTGVTDLDIEKVKIQGKNLIIRAAKVRNEIIKGEPDPMSVDVKVTVDDRRDKLKVKLKNIEANHEQPTEGDQPETPSSD